MLLNIGLAGINEGIYIINRTRREPTQLAYPVAQGLTIVTAYFYPDPDSQPTVKSFEAEI